MDRGARDRQGRASGIWPLTRCGQRGDLVGDETGDGDTGGCGRGRRVADMQATSAADEQEVINDSAIRGNRLRPDA